MKSPLFAIIKRDYTIAFRQIGDLFNPLMFFVIALSLFPLAVSPDGEFLSSIAAGVIWVAALLATIVSLDLLFKSDVEDGSAQQLLLSPVPTWQIILAKVLVHWTLTGIPLIILTPILALMLFLPSEGFGVLVLALLIGTPTLSLFGAVGAALTVGLRKGGMLMPILVLPLYIPVLILGAGSVQNKIMNLPIDGHLSFLSAIFFVALVISPFAAGAALRISVSR